MALFKGKRTGREFIVSSNNGLVKKLLMVMIIKLLDYSVAPRLSNRDKPRLHTITQT